MDEIIVFDELNGEDVENVAHIDRMLYKIGKLEREIEKNKNAIEGSKEFYERRISAIREQIHARELMMESYAVGEYNDNGTKTTKLPNGTLRMTKRVKRTFPDDNELLKYSHANNIQTKLDEKPIKKNILDNIKNTGVVPDGYSETDEVKFSIKTNKTN